MNKPEPTTEIPYKMNAGQRCVDQTVCNQFWNGAQTFKTSDPHPTISGLVYRKMCHKKHYPVWTTPEKLMRDKKLTNSYQKANREELNEKARLKYAEDPEKFKAIQQNRYYEDVEASRRYNRDWYKANPDKRVALVAKRRSQKLGADISFEGIDQYTEHDKKMTDVLFAHARRLKECLGVDFHVDHIQPLSCNGSSKAYNLQVVPAKWNLEKSNNSFAIWGAPFGRSDMHLFDCDIFQPINK